MGRKAIEKILESCGAVLRGHFVLKNRGKKDEYAEIRGCGDHSGLYVNKDALFPPPAVNSILCGEIVNHFMDLGLHKIDVVAGPAVGAIAQLVYIRDYLADYTHILAAVYAEEVDGKKVFRRGFDKLIPGKRVLVVEDIATTGGSARGVVDAVKSLGGEVVGVSLVCNRGGVTAEDLGVPHLFSLYELSGNEVKKYPMEDCPLCREGVPISTNVGHGKQFLEIKDTLPILKAK